MKRFYKEVSAVSDGEGFAVLLDGRPIKTPKRADLRVPSAALAEAIAAEWDAQGEDIDPPSMALTRFANTAIDRVYGREAEVVEKIVAFANDVLCYRAAAPAELVARQQAEWDPLLDWAAERCGARLVVGTGATFLNQPAEALAALRAAVEGRHPFLYPALHQGASILGSLVLTLALAEGRLTAEAAFAASQLHERYQTERWGEDVEAAARAAGLLAELKTAERFIRLAQAP